MFLHLGPSKGMYDSPPPPQGLPKKAIILHLSLARERLTLLLLLVVCPIMATILRLGLAGERPNLLPLLMVCLIMATILHLGLAKERPTLLPLLMVCPIMVTILHLGLARERPTPLHLLIVLFQLGTKNVGSLRTKPFISPHNKYYLNVTSCSNSTLLSTYHYCYGVMNYKPYSQYLLSLSLSLSLSQKFTVYASK